MNRSMDDKAKQLVIDYLLERVDMADLPKDFHLVTLWENENSKTNAFLLSPTDADSQQLYDVVFDKKEHKWILDEYGIINHRVIPANF